MTNLCLRLFLHSSLYLSLGPVSPVPPCCFHLVDDPGKSHSFYYIMNSTQICGLRFLFLRTFTCSFYKFPSFDDRLIQVLYDLYIYILE